VTIHAATMTMSLNEILNKEFYWIVTVIFNYMDDVTLKGPLSLLIIGPLMNGLSLLAIMQFLGKLKNNKR